MHPTFTLFGSPVGSYPLMLLLAVAAAAFVGHKLRGEFGISRRLFLASLLLAVVVGILFARGQSILFELGVGRWLRGARAGLAVQGGILGGFLALVVLARLARARTADLLDFAACLLPLGLAITRLGCLLHGCCYGKPTLFPVALMFTDFRGAARPVGVPLHATQLYLSLVGWIVFYVLVRRRLPKRRYRGQLLLEGLTMISIGRFFIEFLRADRRGPVVWLGMPITQVIALVVALGAGLLLLELRRRGRVREAVVGSRTALGRLALALLVAAGATACSGRAKGVADGGQPDPPGPGIFVGLYDETLGGEFSKTYPPALRPDGAGGVVLAFAEDWRISQGYVAHEGAVDEDDFRQRLTGVAPQIVFQRIGRDGARLMGQGGLRISDPSDGGHHPTIVGNSGGPWLVGWANKHTGTALWSELSGAGAGLRVVDAAGVQGPLHKEPGGECSLGANAGGMLLAGCASTVLRFGAGGQLSWQRPSIPGVDWSRVDGRKGLVWGQPRDPGQ